jgi:hypothetical protein
MADQDPDLACYFDLDPACHFYPDPACHMDPNPACHFDAGPDPDPSFQINANNLEKVIK